MATDCTRRVAVVAMDGSKYADYALEWYLANIHQSHDTLVIVHCPDYRAVVNSHLTKSSSSSLIAVMKQEDAKMKKLVAEFENKIYHARVKGRVKTAYGSAGDVICSQAAEEQASFIVTGCRGLGTFTRTILGSVSDYVLHHSKVPVIIVKHTDREAE